MEQEIWENRQIEDLPGEEWRDVVGYKGLYMVSRKGRVKSLNYHRTGKEQILKPGDNGHGYLKVDLYKNGKPKTSRVNRLVLEAFVPNPEGKPEVDHINGDRTDNRVENLRWVTSRENMENGPSKKVLCVETGIIYPSLMEAYRQTGADHSHIIKCCKGKYKTAGGYHWQYAE